MNARWNWIRIVFEKNKFKKETEIIFFWIEYSKEIKKIG